MMLPTRKVCERYDVCSKTISRWGDDDKMDFPKPTVIRGRKYFDEAELSAWEKAQAVRGVA